MRRGATLLAFLAISFVVAFTGSLFGPDDWYQTINRPSWNPPGWVFGPVWTLLYTLIAVSGWLVWEKRGPGRRAAMIAFGVQHALNAAWSPLFFGLHAPGWALVDITLLLLAIVTTIVLFRREHGPAAALLVPYLAWVSFASVLNATIWHLNS